MKRRLLVALLFGSLGIGSVPHVASASESGGPNSSVTAGSSINQVDTSQFPTVIADLVVPVTARIAIESGVHISATENGTPVTATAGTAPSVSPEVVVVIDRSKSMGSTKFSAVRNAASSFVTSLPADIPVALVSFGSRVTVDARRTTNRQSVTTAINRLNTGGSTSLYDAIVTGSKQFSRRATEKLMIVLSDGGDSNSSRSLQSALKASRRVKTHFIEISRSQTHHRLLEYLGGDNPIFVVTNPSDIDRGFRVASSYINSPVRITFESRAERGTTKDLVISFVVNGQRINVRTTYATPIASGSRQSNVFTNSSTLIVMLGLATLFYGLTIVVFGLLATQGRSVRTRLTPRTPDDPVSTGINIIDRIGQRLSRMLATTSRLERLMQDIDDANVPSGPARFLLVNGLVALGAAIVIGAFSNPLMALLGLVATLVVARKRLTARVKKRRTEFIAQLPDTLQMLSSMLRSGYGLVQALDTVAGEASEPTRGWLGQVMLEVRAGRDLVNSLQALAASIDSLDFDWVVAGIEISREVGGDLAKTLDTVSGTIRERDELRAHINALTAEGRLSAYVMLVLPPAVAVMSLIINPEFGSLLFKSSGIPMMIGAAVLMMIGFAWMRKIIAKVA